jgi:hypothetical protein
MGKKVGFTGTSRGMKPQQKIDVEALLRKLFAEGFDEFHHGLCVGADEQAAKIAKEIGFRVVAHPGLIRDPKNMMYRSDWTGSDETRDPKATIERDRDIVRETERMIATPPSREELLRSGTWTTVRYARTKGRPIDLVLPPAPPAPPSKTPPPRTNAIAGEDPQAPPYMKRGLR